MDIVQVKIKKPTNESSDAEKVKFRELEFEAMNLIVDEVKENLIPYISNINSSQEMYEALSKLMYKALSKLFTMKNIGQIESLKNELRTIKMTNDDIVSL